MNPPETKASVRLLYEDWLLNGNRFMTDPYSIFCAGYNAARHPAPGVMGEAATLLERYRDQMLIEASKRPTSKEVNQLLQRIYAASEGR